MVYLKTLDELRMQVLTQYSMVDIVVLASRLYENIKVNQHNHDCCDQLLDELRALVAKEPDYPDLYFYLGVSLSVLIKYSLEELHLDRHACFLDELRELTNQDTYNYSNDTCDPYDIPCQCLAKSLYDFMVFSQSKGNEDQCQTLLKEMEALATQARDYQVRIQLSLAFVSMIRYMETINNKTEVILLLDRLQQLMKQEYYVAIDALRLLMSYFPENENIRLRLADSLNDTYPETEVEQKPIFEEFFALVKRYPNDINIRRELVKTLKNHFRIAKEQNNITLCNLIREEMLLLAVEFTDDDFINQSLDL